MPERLLPRPILRVVKQRGWPIGFLIEQEHQPGDTRLGRGVELQLGVGQLRLVADRAAVAEPGDQHEHLRLRDRIAAQGCGRQGIPAWWSM